MPMATECTMEDVNNALKAPTHGHMVQPIAFPVQKDPFALIRPKVLFSFNLIFVLF